MISASTRLAVLVSHPIQYYAPIFRRLAQLTDLEVFYSHRATPEQQAAAGYGEPFEWDVDLLGGYRYNYLKNVAKEPRTSNFSGCDTPEIGDRLRDGKFDAVLSLGWHLKSLLQGVAAARRMRVPTMVRGDSQLGLQTNPWKKLAKAGTYPLLLRAFDAALFVGARNRQYFERYHYPQYRLFHSPHCVDTARFAQGSTVDARGQLRARNGIPSDRKIALFVGRLVDFKRPLDLVAACKLLSKQGLIVDVLVAGSGPLETEMKTAAAAGGIRVHALGFQNQSVMPQIYAAADLLVLPSTGRETWGLVCNEALASGIPIVVSDEAGCAPDLARDAAAGRSYVGGNVSALANEIRLTLEIPPDVASIRRVSNEHSVDAAAGGILSALEFFSRRRPLPMEQAAGDLSGTSR